jgi:CarD family transcriptional regulator
MFDIGDIIIYSVHGLCQIDDISEQTVSGVTRTYYVMHPLGETSLKISIPVDSDKVVMLKPMEKDEAEELLQTFKEPQVGWIEDAKQRSRKYMELVNSGDRDEIAKIANLLMRKGLEYKKNSKRLYDQDRSLLQMIQNILFKEMALSLETTVEAIEERVNNMIQL